MKSEVKGVAVEEGYLGRGEGGKEVISSLRRFINTSGEYVN
jgi:hypothetical protein